MLMSKTCFRTPVTGMDDTIQHLLSDPDPYVIPHQFLFKLILHCFNCNAHTSPHMSAPMVDGLFEWILSLEKLSSSVEDLWISVCLGLPPGPLLI